MFEKYSEIIPRYDEFLKSILNFDLISIRVNTIKTDKEFVREKLSEFKLEDVKWYRDAFIVKENKDKIAKTLEHILGYIYIQRLESMIPPLVLEPEKEDVILDMCAAPGSKTTQLAQMMENTGKIIANDVSEKRLRSLLSNIEKYGVLNTIVTKYDGRFFPKINVDKILLDVPCTAEGRNFKEKGEKLSKALSKKQYMLLKRGIEILNEGGIIVYSTCTLSPWENEFIIDQALKNFDNIKLENIKLDIPFVNGINKWNDIEFDEEVKKTARFYPHISGTGGFYVAKIRKI